MEFVAPDKNNKEDIEFLLQLYNDPLVKNEGLNSIDNTTIYKKDIINTIEYFELHNYYFYIINYNSRGIINKVLNKIEGKTLNSDFNSKIKSANLSTDYNVEQAISDIETLDLNTINLPVVINIDDITSSNVSIDQNSLERAKILLKELKGKNINII